MSTLFLTPICRFRRNSSKTERDGLFGDFLVGLGHNSKLILREVLPTFATCFCGRFKSFVSLLYLLLPSLFQSINDPPI